MKLLKILLFLLFLFEVKPNLAQDTLETVYERNKPYAKAITYNDKAYVFFMGDQFCISYNGSGISRINFPTVDGHRLKYSTDSDAIVSDSSIYLILRNADNSLDQYFLIRFDGHRFHPIAIPGEPEAPLILFQDKLFLAVIDGDEKKLISYDGSSVMEIPTSSAPVEYDYELFPTEQYLYLAIGTNTLKRFDGTNMITLPYFEFPHGITEIEPIQGTDDIYILAWNSQILHFDGSNLSEIYREPDYMYLLFMTFLTWENKLFFTMAYRDKIFYFDGTVVREFLLPDGARFAYFANLIVYRDSLLIPAKLPDESKVLYAYDGSSFSRIFDFPNGLDSPKSFIKEGNYVIIPKIQGSEAFEYNGTVFSRIYAPDEKNIRRYLTSTSCFHLWDVVDHEEPGIDIAIENKNCDSSTSSVAIILVCLLKDVRFKNNA